MTRPLESFAVSHRGLRLRVRLYASTRDVDRKYRNGRCRRGGLQVHAFFAPTKCRGARHGGVVALGANGRLEELIPHEVTHAVMHKLGTVTYADDERLASAVGVLTARIIARIRRLGYGS